MIFRQHRNFILHALRAGKPNPLFDLPDVLNPSSPDPNGVVLVSKETWENQVRSAEVALRELLAQSKGQDGAIGTMSSPAATPTSTQNAAESPGLVPVAALANTATQGATLGVDTAMTDDATISNPDAAAESTSTVAGSAAAATQGRASPAPSNSTSAAASGSGSNASAGAPKNRLSRDQMAVLSKMSPAERETVFQSVSIGISCWLWLLGGIRVVAFGG